MKRERVRDGLSRRDNVLSVPANKDCTLVGHGRHSIPDGRSEAEGCFEYETALELDDLGSSGNDRTNKMDQAFSPVPFSLTNVVSDVCPMRALAGFRQARNADCYVVNTMVGGSANGP